MSVNFSRMDGQKEADSQEYFIPDSQEYYVPSSSSSQSKPNHWLQSTHAPAPSPGPALLDDDDYMLERKRLEVVSVLRSEKIQNQIRDKERMPKLVSILIQNLENSIQSSIRSLFYDEFKGYSYNTVVSDINFLEKLTRLPRTRFLITANWLNSEMK